MTERLLALIDIDKTIYDGYSIIDLGKAQAKAGILDRGQFQAMQEEVAFYGQGLLGYEDLVRRLLVDYALGLEGKSYHEILEHACCFFKKSKRFFPFAHNVFDNLSQRFDVHLVTGEPQFIGEAVVSKLGAFGQLSSEFEVENGLLTGQVKDFLATKEDKRRKIDPVLNNYPKKWSLAMGDSVADLDMLSVVENPIFVCPNPAVIDSAIHRLCEGRVVTPQDVDPTISTVLLLAAIFVK